MTLWRRIIVHTLHWACELQDRLHLDQLTHSHILASWSADLDERWNTHIWNNGE